MTSRPNAGTRCSIASLFWLFNVPVNGTFWGNVAPGMVVLTGIAASASTRFVGNLHLQAVPSRDVIAAATVHGFHEGYLIASTFGIFASLIALFVIRQSKGAVGTDVKPAVAAV